VARRSGREARDGQNSAEREGSERWSELGGPSASHEVGRLGGAGGRRDGRNSAAIQRAARRETKTSPVAVRDE
jgi:hypothetical protein